MDRILKKNVTANMYIRPNKGLTRPSKGIRIGSAAKPKLQVMHPKGFTKPKATKPAGPPVTAPRMRPIVSRRTRSGKISGVRGGLRPKGTGFRKGVSTGKPKTFGIK